MNLSDKELESILRDAPRPKASADLQSRLLAQIALPTAVKIGEVRRHHPSPLTPLPVEGRGGPGLSHSSGYGFAAWLRRWWPALAPAAVSLACAGVITYQQIEINQLREAIRELKEEPTAPMVSPEPTPTPQPTNPVEPDERYEQEIESLRTEAEKLSGEIAALEKTRAENEELRQQLAKPIASGLPPEFQEAEEAMERARSINCVNNLKQFGLAVRIWANDNDGAFPPNSLSMSNELSTPKILVCPSDTPRQAASDWGSFTAVNQSYDYLARDGSDLDVQRVLSLCRIHGNVGMCDGSVQMLGTNYMQRLTQRDGKLYSE